MMKIRLKTKEQLIKMGYVENKRSMYNRLVIDGEENETNIDKYTPVKYNGSALTVKIVDLLGKEVDLIALHDNSDIDYCEVKDDRFKFQLPVQCFEKINVKKFKAYKQKLKEEEEKKNCPWKLTDSYNDRYRISFDEEFGYFKTGCTGNIPVDKMELVAKWVLDRCNGYKKEILKKYKRSK